MHTPCNGATEKLRRKIGKLESENKKRRLKIERLENEKPDENPVFYLVVFEGNIGGRHN